MLVILDNLVIDVREFVTYHPGGRFVLQKTVGTDVSKFFFGGYALDSESQKGHNHSNYAKSVANDLAIGYFEPEIPASEEIVDFNKSLSVHMRGGFLNVQLDALQETSTFKRVVSDPRYLGKHFRIHLMTEPQTSRHYTIANVMIPDIYDRYLQALSKQSVEPLHYFLDEKDEDTLHITMKNYQSKTGLSFRFFEERIAS